MTRALNVLNYILVLVAFQGKSVPKHWEWASRSSRGPRFREQCQCWSRRPRLLFLVFERPGRGRQACPETFRLTVLYAGNMFKPRKTACQPALWVPGTPPRVTPCCGQLMAHTTSCLARASRPQRGFVFSSRNTSKVKSLPSRTFNSEHGQLLVSFCLNIVLGLGRQRCGENWTFRP